MPNRIFMPFLNTIISPDRFIRISEKLDSKKTETKREPLISKSASYGAKVMAQGSIKSYPLTADGELSAKFEDITRRIKELDMQAKDVLAESPMIYNKAKEILSSQDTKQTYQEALRLINLGIKSGFNTIYDEENNSKIEFLHRESQVTTPRKIEAIEYKDGEIVKQISMMGENMIKIEKHSPYGFEKYIFSGGELFKYSSGRKEENKTIVDEEFSFYTLGNSDAFNYARDIETSNGFDFHVGKIYKFLAGGYLTEFQKGVDKNLENYIAKIDTDMTFRGDEVSSIKYRADKAKSTIKEYLVNHNDRKVDFYVDFEAPRNIESPGLYKFETTEDTSIKEKYTFLEKGAKLQPASYMENFSVNNGELSSDRYLRFKTEY